MSGVVAVVQCGGRKLGTPAKARDLYTGPLFRACRAAAIRLGARWYIASARHGLVDPARILAPYDATLPAAGDPAWGARVLASLREREARGWLRLVALCSRRYLIGWAEELGAETPLAGLTIGRAIRAANMIGG